MTAREQALKNHKAHDWYYDGWLRPESRPTWNFANPKPNIGYGQTLLLLYKIRNEKPISRVEINKRLGRRITSYSEQYRNLSHAGLIDTSSKGTKISKLGIEYVHEMLSDYI